jgi:hypothetical protein
MARNANCHTRVPNRTRVRERAWQAMRSLRSFDLGQLMSVSEIERSNGTKFVRALARAGYLRMEGEANPSRGTFRSWRLVRDSGPRAPVLRNNGDVFDANTGLIYGRIGQSAYAVLRVEARP